MVSHRLTLLALRKDWSSLTFVPMNLDRKWCLVLTWFTKEKLSSSGPSIQDDLEGDFERDLERDLEGDLEGALEGDSKGDFRGDRIWKGKTKFSVKRRSRSLVLSPWT